LVSKIRNNDENALLCHEPQSNRRFKEIVQEMPEVLECFHITGEFDYLLKVILRNRSHLEKFLLDKLTPVPGMDKIRTSLVLREIKTGGIVPLELASMNSDHE
jgi:DNA-binding Lrp family transcriptional regulator